MGKTRVTIRPSTNSFTLYDLLPNDIKTYKNNETLNKIINVLSFPMEFLNTLYTVSYTHLTLPTICSV